MRYHLRWAGGAAFACGLAALARSSGARAQQAPVVPPTPASPTTGLLEGERSRYIGPNRALLATGLVTVGLSYIPAVVVAVASDQSSDHHLVVPVVGPWLDLGDRPACGVNSIGCDTETTYKVLLVVDGVFQAIGVLTTAASFLSPEHTEVVRAAATRPTIRLGPASLGKGGYGVGAVGRF